jgi:hypothetical protein
MAVIVSPEKTAILPRDVDPNFTDELHGAPNASGGDDIEDSRTEKKYDANIIEQDNYLHKISLDSSKNSKKTRLLSTVEASAH